MFLQFYRIKNTGVAHAHALSQALLGTRVGVPCSTALGLAHELGKSGSPVLVPTELRTTCYLVPVTYNVVRDAHSHA